MRCPRCSAEIADGSQFCVQCGAPAAARSMPIADPSGHGQGAAAPVSPAGPGAATWAPSQSGTGQFSPGWPGTGVQGQEWPGGGVGPGTGVQGQGWPGGGVGPGTGSPAPAGASGGLAVAAGIVAILGVLVVIVACVVPYVRYTGIGGQSSFSIFNYGKNSNGQWFAAEPVGVALLGLAAAVLVMASGRVPGLRWLAAGMLLAFGVQTILLFAGYQFGLISNSSAHTGYAGYIGIVAGLILAAAGVLAAVAGAVGRSGAVSAPAAAAPGGWTGTAR
jgi:zinc-ribbon domain